MKLLPISMATHSLTGPIGASLQKKLNPKIIMAAASTLMFSAFFLSSMVKSWEVFFFTYGIIFPLGTSLAFYTPIMCAWEYFPNNRGLAGGIIVAGFGFGASITGTLSTWLVNPNDEKLGPNPYGTA
jgi:MFS family permease